MSAVSGSHDVVMFERGNGGRIQLVGDVVARLNSHRQLHRAAKEAGGLLLGRRILDCHDIVVDYITEPTGSDVRSRFGFERRARSHQERAEELWESSEGTVNLLGGWHSHPESSPTPSCVDLLDWARQVKRSTFPGDEMFFLIQGQDHIGLWELSRGAFRPTKLRQS